MLGQTYEFKDVKELLAKASEKKSGDELAGVCAGSTLERIAAKEVLGQLTVADIRNHPSVIRICPSWKRLRKKRASR